MESNINTPQSRYRKTLPKPLYSRSNCPTPSRVKNSIKQEYSFKSCAPSFTQSRDFTGFSIAGVSFENNPPVNHIQIKNPKFKPLQQSIEIISPIILDDNFSDINDKSFEFISVGYQENMKNDKKKNETTKLGVKKFLNKSLNSSKTKKKKMCEVHKNSTKKTSKKNPKSLNCSYKFNEDKCKMSILADVEEKSPLSPELFRKKSLENRPTLCHTEGIENIPILQNSDFCSNSPYNVFPSIRQSINENLKLHTTCKIINFFTVLSYYNTLQLSSQKHDSIWKTSCLEKLFKCFYIYPELDDYNIEICEKFISFAFTPFSFSDILHKSLLVTVYTRVKKIDPLPEDPEDLIVEITISNRENFHIETQFPLLGLTNVLFLDCYFPEVLEKLIGLCDICEVNFLDVIFEITRINVDFLRKKMFNNLINRGRKCLELIFFMFAGLTVYFYSIFQNEKNLKKVSKEVVRMSKDNLQEVLDVARNAYTSQATQV
ncbi:hypothetical protein SteCoe_4932 [Stentor coeruleus]|uniref:Uncharacterized protein n=1 Tax=Stentor coeruleus TaxID=5963 RepID=A0A1R2CTM2_9CILI|nr:hypothetical protein SteCoe_4932 [Stentor coeruleus]